MPRPRRSRPTRPAPREKITHDDLVAMTDLTWEQVLKLLNSEVPCCPDCMPGRTEWRPL
jgi:hypothetical protein